MGRMKDYYLELQENATALAWNYGEVDGRDKFINTFGAENAHVYDDAPRIPAPEHSVMISGHWHIDQMAFAQRTPDGKLVFSDDGKLPIIKGNH